MQNIDRYYRLFSEEVYKEAGLADLGLDAGGEATPTDANNAPADPGATTPPPADNTQQPQEPEKSDEAKEAEKKAELELQGRISNVLSDISDMLGPETMRYYKEVEDKAVAYLKTYQGDIDEILDNMQDIGLKILSTSKKNSFIDRDNIAYMATMEGAVDIKHRVKGIPVQNAVNKPEELTKPIE